MERKGKEEGMARMDKRNKEKSRNRHVSMKNDK